MARPYDIEKPLELALYAVHTLQRVTNVSGFLRKQVDKVTAPAQAGSVSNGSFVNDAYAGGKWAVNNKFSKFVFNAADYAIGHGKDYPNPTPEQSALVNTSHLGDCVLESVIATIKDPSRTGILGGLVTIWTMPFAAAGGAALGLAGAAAGGLADSAAILWLSLAPERKPYTVVAAQLGAAIGSVVSVAAAAAVVPITVATIYICKGYISQS